MTFTLELPELASQQEVVVITLLSKVLLDKDAGKRHALKF